MAEKIEKPKCPKCGSGEVYYRRILKEFVCRRCGHSWKDEHGYQRSQQGRKEGKNRKDLGQQVFLGYENR